MIRQVCRVLYSYAAWVVRVVVVIAADALGQEELISLSG